MEWLGFGRGFVFNEQTICRNVWTDEARRRSIEARKLSKAALKATEASKLDRESSHAWHYGNDASNTAQDIIDSEETPNLVETHALHAYAARLHLAAAKIHAPKKGLSHRKAAKLHREAAEAHTKAKEAHIESGIMEQDKGADDISHIHRPLD